MAENPVLTAGHSNLEAPRFIDLLLGQGVELLVDVRRFPGSRHVPWTNSESGRRVARDASGRARSSSRAHIDGIRSS